MATTTSTMSCVCARVGFGFRVGIPVADYLFGRTGTCTKCATACERARTPSPGDSRRGFVSGRARSRGGACLCPHVFTRRIAEEHAEGRDICPEFRPPHHQCRHLFDTLNHRRWALSFLKGSVKRMLTWRDGGGGVYW